MDGVNRLLSLLDEHYPMDGMKCFLTYDSPWQLMVATILSAQCTDARVNMVTAELFKKYPDIASFAEADVGELERDVKSTGFYHNKAKNINLSMKKLLNEFNGEMPGDIDVLTSFPGVGRKTANVILCHVFDIPAVVVDTHVARVSGRLGLTESTDPAKIERDLMDILPMEHWIRFNTQIITHGRAVCSALRPRCGQCPLAEVCRKKFTKQ